MYSGHQAEPFICVLFGSFVYNELSNAWRNVLQWLDDGLCSMASCIQTRSTSILEKTAIERKGNFLSIVFSSFLSINVLSDV